MRPHEGKRAFNRGVKVEHLALCGIVWAELHCGACLSADPAAERRRIEAAFSAWRSLPFDDAAALRYGEIRARLQRAGRLIGANDLLIAAIALANGLTLVTHNTAEFARIEGLAIEDWEAETDQAGQGEEPRG